MFGTLTHFALPCPLPCLKVPSRCAGVTIITRTFRVGDGVLRAFHLPTKARPLARVNVVRDVARVAGLTDAIRRLKGLGGATDSLAGTGPNIKSVIPINGPGCAGRAITSREIGRTKRAGHRGAGTRPALGAGVPGQGL